MEFKIIYVTSLILACAAGNPLSTNTTEVIDFSETTTVVYNSSLDSNDTSERANQQIPAAFIIGKSNGEMLRCSYNNINDCTVFNKAGSTVTSTVTSGEYIYAGLDSGTMWRCNLYRADSCMDFNTAGSSVNALAVAESYIYAGLGSGRIWRCKNNQADSCSTYFNAEGSVMSLAATEEYIFAGLDSGKMLRCNRKGAVTCYVFNTAGSSLTALAVTGNTVFAGTASGTMWKCSSIVSNSCTDLNKGGSAIRSLSLFNKKIYAVLSSGTIWSCEMNTANTCEDLKYDGDAMSISNVYSYSSLESNYRDENIKCSWQKPGKCPPHVFYYNIEERMMFNVHIKNGKVYDAQGELFDTSKADQSHSGIAAIFVMEPSGKILISNTHIVYLIHHSSLMAGNPVAAAGEIKISQGVITDITTCSGHYRPSVDLNKQVLQSLYLQGYTSNVDVTPCRVKIVY